MLVKDHHTQKEHDHDATCMNVTKDSNTNITNNALHNNKILMPKFDNCRLRCDKKNVMCQQTLWTLRFCFKYLRPIFYTTYIM